VELTLQALSPLPDGRGETGFWLPGPKIIAHSKEGASPTNALHKHARIRATLVRAPVDTVKEKTSLMKSEAAEVFVWILAIAALVFLVIVIGA